MSGITVPHTTLKALVTSKLTGAGIPEEHALIVADVLVHADLRGVSSHGVLRTEHYVKRIKEGGLNPNPSFSVNNTGPCTAVFDGDDALGHVVAKEAMNHAISLAGTNGVGMVSVTNSSHCGALSYFVQQATDQKMLGMMMVQTDKVVVPFGGAQAFFGTNPIAYGLPTHGNPIILDMATSNVAFGKVLHAREAGTAIPDDWGVDEYGNPTTDPHQVRALLPFAGAKGYGLAMIVDAFSGILAGAAFGPHIVPMYGEYHKKRKLGQFICALNPAAFGDPAAFLDNMTQMVEEVRQVQPAAGFQQVLTPGEPEQLKEIHRLQHGVPIPESVYQYLSGE